MADLNFQIVGVEAATRGLVPLMHFKLRIDCANPAESIQGLLLNAQIQIQCPQRRYDASEKERLVELFGTPERWGQTLGNRVWTHVNATVGAFAGTTDTILQVPCTFDLNIAATKYLYALEDGEIPLLFLFSGSAFYYSSTGPMQVERISWDKECVYRIPVQSWKELMEEHYPNCAWINLNKDIFDRLYEYRRLHGTATWEQTVEKLLDGQETTDTTDVSPGQLPQEAPA